MTEKALSLSLLVLSSHFPFASHSPTFSSKRKTNLCLYYLSLILCVHPLTFLFLLVGIPNLMLIHHVVRKSSHDCFYPPFSAPKILPMHASFQASSLVVILQHFSHSSSHASILPRCILYLLIFSHHLFVQLSMLAFPVTNDAVLCVSRSLKAGRRRQERAGCQRSHCFLKNLTFLQEVKEDTNNYS